MKDHRCCYCQQVFQPAPYHPHQLVCNQPACQRQRRRDYHRQKITSDPLYRQVCLESPRKWREAHPHYWKRYRQDHPQQVERNRRQQRWRDEKRRLANRPALPSRCRQPQIIRRDRILTKPWEAWPRAATCEAATRCRPIARSHLLKPVAPQGLAVQENPMPREARAADLRAARRHPLAWTIFHHAD